MIAAEPPLSAIDAMTSVDSVQEAAATIATPEVQQQQNGHRVFNLSAVACLSHCHCLLIFTEVLI